MFLIRESGHPCNIVHPVVKLGSYETLVSQQEVDFRSPNSKHLFSNADNTETPDKVGEQSSILQILSEVKKTNEHFGVMLKRDYRS